MDTYGARLGDKELNLRECVREYYLVESLEVTGNDG